MVPLKYPSNFWRAAEMCLINCEINLFLTKSASCVIAPTAVAKQGATLKLYVMAVTISAEDISKLLQQLKSGFERTINWNKYQSKVSIKAQNPYLTFQISNCLD